MCMPCEYIYINVSLWVYVTSGDVIEEMKHSCVINICQSSESNQLMTITLSCNWSIAMNRIAPPSPQHSDSHFPPPTTCMYSIHICIYEVWFFSQCLSLYVRVACLEGYAYHTRACMCGDEFIVAYICRPHVYLDCISICTCVYLCVEAYKYLRESV